MENDAGLLFDLVVALAVALAGGWLASRLGFSVLAGYVAAGLIIGPFTPGFEGDVERLRLLANVGVILLMFGIGAEFSLRDIARSGVAVNVAAVAQTAAMMAAGTALGLALGWGRDQSLFAGAAIAISSSMVMVKLLGERGEMNTTFGRTAIAWSILQDLCAIVIVAALIGLTESGDIATNVSLAALKTVAFVGGMLVLGVRIIPWLLNQIADRGSRELFVLAIAALALGTALISEEVGLSLALGAFLAGIVVSEADLSHRVLGDLLPARDVFGVLFFVSAGMLIEPSVIADNLVPFILLIALIVPVKGVLAALAARAAGMEWRPSALTGATLAQAGEFSFVLITLGVEEHAVTDETFSLVVAAVAVSIVASPAVLGLTSRTVARIIRDAPVRTVPAARPRGLGRKAVICGFGETGKTVFSALSSRFDVVVVDEDPRALAGLDRQGVPYINADASSVSAIHAMELEDCRVLMVTISDPFAARLLVERARAMYPDLDIIARAQTQDEGWRLIWAGANESVVAGREVALEIVRHGLHRFGIDSRQALAIVQRLRLGDGH